MNEGYDPACSELYDDSEIAYQPTYVTPGHYEDSPNVSSSDDEPGRDYAISGVVNPYSALSKHVASPFTPRYEPSEAIPDGTGTSERQEYHVQPLLDTSTPAYAPSHTAGSPSERSDASSLSGGYPSPISSIQPSVLTLDDRERFYQPSFKSEVSSPDSAISDRDGTVPIKNSLEVDLATTISPLANIAFDPLPPERSTQKQIIEEFDEDDIDEENKVNEDFEGFEREEQPESQVDGIIADIFGESDAEEEFEGFAENEIEKELPIEQTVEQQEQPPKPDSQGDSKSDGDEGSETDNEEDQFVSDFDKIMAKKKEELQRRRRRNRDIEFLNDSDDQILATISRMKVAAEEDRQLLADNQPATKKLKMISEVTSLLRRADLKAALVDNGMLSAITDWLAPLPGHTLPNLVIRDTMLSCLNEFQSLSTEVLQDSGIGKALMYLYKHPLETRENKDRAGRLINEWLRPIFNLTSDYRTLTKEERKQLDYEHLPRRRNIDNENYSRRDINREMDGEPKGLLRPGDPGWVARARVPQPSNKDYIVRPKWRVTDGDRSAGENEDDAEDEEDSRQTFRRKRKAPSSAGNLGATSRIEAHIRNLTQMARHKHSKVARAVTMSVEGRKMTL